ncbi:MAG: ribose 5-phosphate isomerase B [Candidatus Melainabacteria bacterium]
MSPPQSADTAPMPKAIVLGCDHAGFQLKQALMKHMNSHPVAKGIRQVDVGCFTPESVDYPAIANLLAQQMTSVKESVGILVCGSGVGICMAANRHAHIRAVRAHDLSTAVMSRRHNDANVLCFGERFIAAPLAADIFDAWLATAFEGGRHAKRVDLMSAVPASC